MELMKKLQLPKYLILFLIGGITYFMIEIAFRGFSHWTMAILGGICFISIGAINEFIPWEMKLWKQCLLGATIITVLEFITGVIVNIWLGWKVWDYSEMPLNLLGQICLPFTLIWIVISLVAIVVDDYLRYKLFNEEKPRYKLF